MKWIDKMVERITRKETALNDRFCVNRHTVVCQSGTTDYVSVTIDNTDGFDFDFWTKQLCFEKDCNCLLYTSPSPRDRQKSRMPSSA